MAMQKRYLAGLLLLLLGTASLAAQQAPTMQAGPGPRMGAPGMHGFGMAYSPFAGVQFTEAQRKSINELMTKQREAYQQRIERLQTIRNRLRKLFAAEIWDAEAITAAYDEIFVEQRKGIQAMTRTRNAVYEMLSDEQRAQLRQSRQQTQGSTPMTEQPVTNPGQ
jgi:Spy/CpxP family protein refolding chaperone